MNLVHVIVVKNINFVVLIHNLYNSPKIWIVFVGINIDYKMMFRELLILNNSK